jgi:Taurine catabolism dioxygenase TauD, TfdA family
MIGETQQTDLEREGLLVFHDIEQSCAVNVMYSLAATLGRPYYYYPYITEIRPRTGQPLDSSGGCGRFLPHTDHAWHPLPPRYVIMYCCDPGEQGSGLATFASIAKALSGLSDLEKLFLQIADFWFPAPVSLNAPGHIGRILESHYARIHPRAVSSFGNGLFAKLYRRILECEQPVGVRAKTMWVLDNHSVCHGRLEIRQGINSNRFHLRLYAEGIGQ